MPKDTQGRFEELSRRMMLLQVQARSLWHIGNKIKAERIADTISKIANIRLKYIYQ